MPYLQFHRLTLLDILGCDDNLLDLSRQKVEEIVRELRPLDRDFHKDIACQLLGRECHFTLAIHLLHLIRNLRLGQFLIFREAEIMHDFRQDLPFLLLQGH